MAGVEGKGEIKIKGGIASKGEALVINGRLLVKFVDRGTQRTGYGSAQIKDGVADFGEARVIDGALRIQI